jgi:hypothetical protein
VVHLILKKCGETVERSYRKDREELISFSLSKKVTRKHSRKYKE